MDAEHRDGLLRRLGSTLHHSQQSRRANVSQPQAPEAPRAWRPPSRTRPNARTKNSAPAAPRSDARRWTGGPKGNPEGTAASAAGLDLGGGRLNLKPPDVIVPASAAHRQQQQQQQQQPSEVPCVVVFDLETTGLNKDRNRIIEIGRGERQRPDAPTDVHPGQPRSVRRPAARRRPDRHHQRHGERPAVPSFQRAAELFQEYIDEARRRCGGASVLLAVTTRVSSTPGFSRPSTDDSVASTEDWRFVDTLPLARKTLAKEAVPGGSYKLESLAAHFGVDTAGASAHRAEADARMLGDVLQRLVGCSLEGTAGTSIAADDVEHSELAEALSAMKPHVNAFSWATRRRTRCGGRWGRWGRRRRATRSNRTGASGRAVVVSAAAAAASTALGFGATSIVTSDGEDIDVESSANIPESELDDLTYSDDGDEEDVSSAKAEAFFAREEKELERASASASGKMVRRGCSFSFWIQADPINGFVPETMDFARMVEADEQAPGRRPPPEPGTRIDRSCTLCTPSCARTTARGRRSRWIR